MPNGIKISEMDKSESIEELDLVEFSKRTGADSYETKNITIEDLSKTINKGMASQIDLISKQDKLIEGDNISITESGIISAVDTVYDDTEIKQSINQKQEKLISSENIKTINGQSLLGEGDLLVGEGLTYEAGENIIIEDRTISAQVPTKNSELENDCNFTTASDVSIAIFDALKNKTITYNLQISKINKESEYIQMSEFDFYDINGMRIIPQSVSCNSLPYSESTKVEHLIDGTLSTYFAAEWIDNFMLTFELPSEPAGYAYATCGDSIGGGSPVSWKLADSKGIVDIINDAEVPEDPYTWTQKFMFKKNPFINDKAASFETTYSSNKIVDLLKTKQTKLAPGINIQTINGETILKTGNLELQKTLVPGDNITIDPETNIISAIGGGSDVIANPEGEATDDLTKIQIDDTVYSIEGSGSDVTKEYVDTELTKKQDTLTAGEGIKIENNVISINNEPADMWVEDISSTTFIIHTPNTNAECHISFADDDSAACGGRKVTRQNIEGLMPILMGRIVWDKRWSSWFLITLDKSYVENRFSTSDYNATPIFDTNLQALGESIYIYVLKGAWPYSNNYSVELSIKGDLYTIGNDLSLYTTDLTDDELEFVKATIIEKLENANPDLQYATKGWVKDKLVDKQDKLIAGSNIIIDDDNIISAVGGDVTKEYVDSEINKIKYGYSIKNYIENEYIAQDGKAYADGNYIRSHKIPVEPSSKIKYWCGAFPDGHCLTEWDANDNFLDYWNPRNLVRSINLKANTSYIIATFYKPNLADGYNKVTLSDDTVLFEASETEQTEGLEDVKAEIKNKQDIIDNILTTEDKTIVGAINELKMLISNLPIFSYDSLGYEVPWSWYIQNENGTKTNSVLINTNIKPFTSENINKPFTFEIEFTNVEFSGEQYGEKVERPYLTLGVFTNGLNSPNTFIILGSDLNAQTTVRNRGTNIGSGFIFDYNPPNIDKNVYKVVWTRISNDLSVVFYKNGEQINILTYTQEQDTNDYQLNVACAGWYNDREMFDYAPIHINYARFKYNVLEE